MDLYLFGRVKKFGKNHVVFENSYKGQIIYVSNPEAFEKDKHFKLYVYNYANEYTKALYGFSTWEERVLFENLVAVPGVGPKTALGILKLTFNKVIGFVLEANVEELAKCSLVGLKTANQIVLELKPKYKNTPYKPQDAQQVQKLVSVQNSLKTLGFNKRQIDFAFRNLKSESTAESMIENAIKIIANADFS